MVTHNINTPADLQQYKNADGDYEIKGHAEIACGLVVEKSLRVTGSLSIEAGWSIEAGGCRRRHHRGRRGLTDY